MSSEPTNEPMKLKPEEIRFWESVFLIALVKEGTAHFSAARADYAITERRERVQAPEPDPSPYRRNTLEE